VEVLRLEEGLQAVEGVREQGVGDEEGGEGAGA